VLPGPIEEKLSAQDNPALSEQVLKAVAEDALVLLAANRRAHLYAEAGMCSHWLRPHQTRWTAAGGFALPSGYGGAPHYRAGLPEFDWSVKLEFEPRAPGALDAKQNRTVFYGFRNLVEFGN
jgi:hypothetical protein